MKIIFMGTPEFAERALESIIEAGHEVMLVVTQPDKPCGRGKEVQMSAVKQCALRHDLEVFQPERIKRAEAVEVLKKYPADLYVVAAFGQILSQEILDMPTYGCLNIHASLLPKYRGSAPIQWSIIRGEKKTGVTVMQMSAGVDTGDMIDKKEVVIEDSDTGQTLHDKLSEAGAELIVTTLKQMQDGPLTKTAQNEEEATYAPMLSKQMGSIDWTQPAVELERLIRALNPWPCTYTKYHNKNLKIWQAKVIHEPADEAPGTVSKVRADSIIVNTGEEQLSLLSVQPEGKKRMAVSDFLRGYPVQPQMKFGDESLMER